MKKIHLFFVMLAFLFLTSQLSAQTNYYYGTGGAMNSNVWATTDGGPYNQYVDLTTGGVLNFNHPATITGPNIAWLAATAVNVNANVKFTSSSGFIIGSFGNKVYTINVASGVTFDGGNQIFAGNMGVGIIKNGLGTLAFVNGGNTGGFTLNEGTMVCLQNNSLAAGALTINGGVLAASTNFTVKNTSTTVNGDFQVGAMTANCPPSISNSNITFIPMNIGSSMRKITIGGTGTYAFGAISGTGAAGIEVLATSTGIIQLNGVNSYTGGTKVTSGILQIGAANGLSGDLILNGGTLKTGNTTGFSDATAGTLQVTNNSTISLGTGIHTINFNASNGVAWTPGKTLNIKGWVGAAGLSGTAGQVFIGTDATGVTADQLAQITVNGSPAAILATGEIVSTAISLPAGPALVPQTGTVDFDVSVTFTDNPTWRAAITAVRSFNTVLTPTVDYDIAPGVITLHPSGLNPALTSTGGRLLVIESAGFANSAISVTITAGQATQLVITSQPQAPATSGGALLAQPKVMAVDQYGNKVTNVSITATVSSGPWTLGGTVTMTTPTSGNNVGMAVYAGLTCTSTSTTDFTPPTIKFTTTAGPFTVTSNPFVLPILTGATTATVDAPFDVTFTGNDTWRNAISNVVISGVAVDPSAYNTTVAGKITFTPAASTLLQTANTKQIMVNATGFPTEVVSQAIAAGAAAKLTVTKLPVADVLNVPFSIQPVVTIQDQFGNKIATSTASVTASAGTTDWTLGGTTTVAAVAGVCTFTDLTVTSSTNVPGAIINFNSAPLTSTSAIFNIGPTAVNEVIDNTVALIYTNADNRITVKCTNGISSESTVAVYNVTGQRLVSNRLTNNITVLNQSFQSGIYLVSVSNAGKTVTRRIVLN
jgi:autotransporter-associated beta strand protein